MTAQDQGSRGILDEFEQVRGVRADADWATEAWAVLVLRDGVREAVVDRGLRDVLDLVRRSGEGPEELHGPAREWAADQQRRWLEDQAEVLEEDDDVHLRDLPWGACLFGAPLCLGFWLVFAMQGEWRRTVTLGLVLAPVAIPALAMLARWAYERVLHRRSQPVAVVVSALAVAVGAGALAGVFAVTSAHPLGVLPIWWFGVLAMGYGAAGAALLRVRPERSSTRVRPLDDRRWEAEVSYHLRDAGSSEPAVQRVLEEARRHVADTGTPLAAEFGAPRTYAARFRPEQQIRSLRGALRQVPGMVIGVSALVGVFVDHHSATYRWAMGVLAVVVVWAAGRAMLRHGMAWWRERRQGSPNRPRSSTRGSA